MSETKWTPGKWKVRIGGTSTGRGPMVYTEGRHYDDGSEFEIADCGCSEATGGGKRWKRTPDADMIEANGHLIAAAPELYEALTNLTMAAELMIDIGDKSWVEIHDIARSALAKARGEAR